MRTRIEAQRQVEVLCIFRDSMDDDSANADGIGGMDHPMRRIPEQGPAQTTPMKRGVHSETPQYGDRNWIGHLSPEPARCVSTMIAPEANA